MFFEEKLIAIITTIILLFIISIFLISKNELLASNQIISNLNIFITETLTEELKKRDGTLISLASIFIGIYFTTFTFMGTISYKSTLSLLNKEQFKNLLIYIRNAFLASFSYIIFSLISPLISESNWVFSLISVPLLSYILLSALRFGWLIYLILARDMHQFIENKKDYEYEKAKLEYIISSLEKYFLNKELENQDLLRKKTDELIKSRKKDSTS
jgi:hypothetical protein